MAEDEIVRIRVGNHLVGIVGLKNAISHVAGNWPDIDAQKAREELFLILKRCNYIPQKAEERYRDAFYREFKKAMGESIPQEQNRELVITVFGQGCFRCDGLEQSVYEVLTEIEIPARVEHIRDPMEIGKAGVMGVPALAIGDKIVCVGTVPPKAKIKKWLTSWQSQES